jgi:hypothetical protein
MPIKIMLIVLILLALPGVLPASLVNQLLVTNVTSTVNTTDDYLVFIACNAAFGTIPAACSIALPVQINHGNPVPAGTFTNQEPVSSPISISNGFLTAIGLDSTGTHVVIGLENIVSSWPFATPESTVISYLQTANGAGLSAFFDTNLSGTIPETSSFWIPYMPGTITTGNLEEFSGGIAIGTLSATLISVPEPRTLGITGFLLASGLLFWCLRTR